MTPETVLTELTAFQEEFSSYLDSLSIDPATASAQVTTREKERLDVTVSEAGWQCQDKFYATAQELLSEKSPEFTKEWAGQLMDKLQDLADSELQQEQMASDT